MYSGRRTRSSSGTSSGTGRHVTIWRQAESREKGWRRMYLACRITFLQRLLKKVQMLVSEMSTLMSKKRDWKGSNCKRNSWTITETRRLHWRASRETDRWNSALVQLRRRSRKSLMHLGKT